MNQGPRWRKSSYSGGNGGQCVEVADFAAATGVRDSKNVTGGTLAFGHQRWSEFVAATTSAG